jgi:hypothetical protein
MGKLSAIKPRLSAGADRIIGTRNCGSGATRLGIGTQEEVFLINRWTDFGWMTHEISQIFDTFDGRDLALTP